MPGPSEGCEGGEGGRDQADHHVRHRHVADVHVGARPQLRSPGGDGYHQTGTLLVTHSDVADASSFMAYRHSKWQEMHLVGGFLCLELCLYSL